MYPLPIPFRVKLKKYTEIRATKNNNTIYLLFSVISHNSHKVTNKVKDGMKQKSYNVKTAVAHTESLPKDYKSKSYKQWCRSRGGEKRHDASKFNE